MTLDSETIDSLYKIARKLVRNRPKFGFVYDREDFVQIAVAAALEAAERYDSSKGDLLSFLYVRMKGSIIDTIRTYMGKKLPNGGYRDHKTIRFSQMDKSDVCYDLDSESSILDYGLEDKSVQDPSLRLEIRDTLRNWKQDNNITNKEWFILKMRIGECLTQSEAGRTLGYSCTKRTCSNLHQLETKLLRRTQLRKPKIHRIYIEGSNTVITKKSSSCVSV